MGAGVQGGWGGRGQLGTRQWPSGGRPGHLTSHRRALVLAVAAAAGAGAIWLTLWTARRVQTQLPQPGPKAAPSSGEGGLVVLPESLRGVLRV